MLIDINASFGGRESIQHFSIDTMRSQLERTPYGAAFVHCRQGISDQLAANSQVLDACQNEPKWIPVGVLNPRDIFTWQSEADRFLRAGARLFRIYPDESSWPVDSVFADQVLERLAGTGGALLIDATTPGLPSRLAERASMHEVPVIFTEARYYPLTELLPLARRYDNVYIETSRLTSPNGIEHCVSEVGAGRLLYGSGTSRYPAWVAWQTLERARISDADRNAIAWQNAAKLFGIQPTDTGSPRPVDGTDVPAFDIHLHDKFPGAPFPPFTPEAYAEELARSNITGGVCSSATGIFHDLEQGNDDTARLMSNVPNLLGYVVVDPRYPKESMRELERLETDDRFVGVKVHCAHAKTPTNSPEMRRLFDIIAPYQRPVLIHNLGSDWPEALNAIAHANPDLTIIAAHAGYGDGPVPTHDAAVRLSESPNVVIEFCSTYLATGAIRRGIEALGAERVLFGSDFPLIALPYMRAAYHDAELSDTEAMQIYTLNAQRLFPQLHDHWQEPSLRRQGVSS